MTKAYLGNIYYLCGECAQVLWNNSSGVSDQIGWCLNSMCKEYMVRYTIPAPSVELVVKEDVKCE